MLVAFTRFPELNKELPNGNIIYGTSRIEPPPASKLNEYDHFLYTGCKAAYERDRNACQDLIRKDYPGAELVDVKVVNKHQLILVRNEGQLHVFFEGTKNDSLKNAIYDWAINIMTGYSSLANDKSSKESFLNSDLFQLGKKINDQSGLAFTVLKKGGEKYLMAFQAIVDEWSKRGPIEHFAGHSHGGFLAAFLKGARKVTTFNPQNPQDREEVRNFFLDGWSNYYYIFQKYVFKAKGEVLGKGAHPLNGFEPYIPKPSSKTDSQSPSENVLEGARGSVPRKYERLTLLKAEDPKQQPSSQSAPLMPGSEKTHPTQAEPVKTEQTDVPKPSENDKTAKLALEAERLELETAQAVASLENEIVSKLGEELEQLSNQMKPLKEELERLFREDPEKWEQMTKELQAEFEKKQLTATEKWTKFAQGAAYAIKGVIEIADRAEQDKAILREVKDTGRAGEEHFNNIEKSLSYHRMTYSKELTKGKYFNSPNAYFTHLDEMVKQYQHSSKMLKKLLADNHHRQKDTKTLLKENKSLHADVTKYFGKVIKKKQQVGSAIGGFFTFAKVAGQIISLVPGGQIVGGAVSLAGEVGGAATNHIQNKTVGKSMREHQQTAGKVSQAAETNFRVATQLKQEEAEIQGFQAQQREFNRTEGARIFDPAKHQKILADDLSRVGEIKKDIKKEIREVNQAISKEKKALTEAEKKLSYAKRKKSKKKIKTAEAEIQRRHANINAHKKDLKTLESQKNDTKAEAKETSNALEVARFVAGARQVEFDNLARQNPGNETEQEKKERERIEAFIFQLGRNEEMFERAQAPWDEIVGKITGQLSDFEKALEGISQEFAPQNATLQKILFYCKHVTVLGGKTYEGVRLFNKATEVYAKNLSALLELHGDFGSADATKVDWTKVFELFFKGKLSVPAGAALVGFVVANVALPFLQAVTIGFAIFQAARPLWKAFRSGSIDTKKEPTGLEKALLDLNGSLIKLQDFFHDQNVQLDKRFSEKFLQLAADVTGLSEEILNTLDRGIKEILSKADCVEFNRYRDKIDDVNKGFRVKTTKSLLLAQSQSQPNQIDELLKTSLVKMGFDATKLNLEKASTRDIFSVLASMLPNEREKIVETFLIDIATELKETEATDHSGYKFETGNLRINPQVADFTLLALNPEYFSGFLRNYLLFRLQNSNEQLNWVKEIPNGMLLQASSRRFIEVIESFCSPKADDKSQPFDALVRAPKNAARIKRMAGDVRVKIQKIEEFYLFLPPLIQQLLKSRDSIVAEKEKFRKLTVEIVKKPCIVSAQKDACKSYSQVRDRSLKENFVGYSKFYWSEILNKSVLDYLLSLDLIKVYDDKAYTLSFMGDVYRWSGLAAQLGIAIVAQPYLIYKYAQDRDMDNAFRKSFEVTTVGGWLPQASVMFLQSYRPQIRLFSQLPLKDIFYPFAGMTKKEEYYQKIDKLIPHFCNRLFGRHFLTEHRTLLEKFTPLVDENKISNMNLQNITELCIEGPIVKLGKLILSTQEVEKNATLYHRQIIYLDLKERTLGLTANTKQKELHKFIQADLNLESPQKPIVDVLLNEELMSVEDIKQIPTAPVQASSKDYDDGTKKIINDYYNFLDHVVEKQALSKDNLFEKLVETSQIVPCIDEEGVPLAFPSVMLETVEQWANKELPYLEATGSGSLIPFYKFSPADGKLYICYRFKPLHNLKETKKYRTQMVAEIDPLCLWSFKKDLKSDVSTQLMTEFYMNWFYGGFSTLGQNKETLGLPGKGSHLFQNKVFYAPQEVSFPGLFKLWQLAPDKMISYRSYEYTKELSVGLWRCVKEEGNPSEVSKTMFKRLPYPNVDEDFAQVWLAQRKAKNQFEECEKNFNDDFAVAWAMIKHLSGMPDHALFKLMKEYFSIKVHRNELDVNRHALYSAEISLSDDETFINTPAAFVNLFVEELKNSPSQFMTDLRADASALKAIETYLDDPKSKMEFRSSGNSQNAEHSLMRLPRLDDCCYINASLQAIFSLPLAEDIRKYEGKHSVAIGLKKVLALCDQKELLKLHSELYLFRDALFNDYPEQPVDFYKDEIDQKDAAICIETMLGALGFVYNVEHRDNSQQKPVITVKPQRLIPLPASGGKFSNLIQNYFFEVSKTNAFVRKIKGKAPEILCFQAPLIGKEAQLPANGLIDMSNYMEGPSKKMYRLTACVVHHGVTALDGVYTAFVRKKDSWFHTHDELIQPTSFEAVKSAKGYVYLFEKVPD